MTHNWNIQFESYPPGSSRGNTMGEGLRRIKEAFYERFTVQHRITESVSPTVEHKEGECSIAQLVEEGETPASNYVTGAIQILEDSNPASAVLYYDSGSALEAVVSNDHGSFDGLGDDDHSGYKNTSSYYGYLQTDPVTPYNPVMGTSEPRGEFRVGSITGLPTDIYDDDTSYEVMSIGGHATLDVDGAAYHSKVYGNDEITAMFDDDAKIALNLQSGKWDGILVGGDDYTAGDVGVIGDINMGEINFITPFFVTAQTNSDADMAFMVFGPACITAGMAPDTEFTPAGGSLFDSSFFRFDVLSDLTTITVSWSHFTLS